MPYIPHIVDGRVSCTRTGRPGLAQQAEHLQRRTGVQGAGRLVREDHGRAGDERAGDGDALLLPAGQLSGPVAHPPRQPHPLDHRGDEGVVGPVTAQPERQRDVLQDRESGQQVEPLEHEADTLPAQPGERLLPHPGDLAPFQGDRSRGGPVQPGRAVEERTASSRTASVFSMNGSVAVRADRSSTVG
ncbi:hypothetical protein GCM10023194_05710 [Planotetraspora phitsanulokensis]|uniref:Uncharacterized protein n=1 Tax=Planotetraspora phitsanulokensis TaxID=575192 RepID=A0A8J3XF05_9ACTN|nr:hypothetical protein Pph01_40700 [Planotetraspora phitsanulokensis]